MTRQLYILFSVILVMIFSCVQKNEPKANAVARVNNEYLKKSDLKSILSPGTMPSDSARIVNMYINNWITEKLVISKAYENFNTDSLNIAINEQVETYRNSLISYVYEKELVKQKLDTLVSDVDIEKYYNDHQRDFELKENIIKVLYIKVKRKAPSIDKLKNLYKSDQPKDRQSLENYCKQHADNFYLDDNNWLLFSDLLREIPIQTYNQELFLQNNRFVEVADSSSYYFLNIKGFKIKNGSSPLSFEKENIRNIILNKRKMQLISRMKEDVYNEGLEKKYFETY